MAAVVQKNGMKPLQMVNGNLSHLDVNDGALNVVKLEDGQCVVKTECVDTNTAMTGCYVTNDNSYIVKHEYGDNSQLLPLNSTVSEANSGGDEPEIDIVINNVVCSFSVRCHLNLRQIALKGVNVEYRRENGMVTMKLRKPYTTASIWSSGKITCTGATSEEQSHVAARRFARCLQKLGFKARFTNYRVVNVLGTCSMPFAIRITAFSEKYKEFAEYEPELHPGVTYKLKKPKATLKIFSTGSITVTAPSVADVQQAIEQIYPLVLEFRKERSKEDELTLEKRRAQGRKRKYSDTFVQYGHETETEEEEEEEEEPEEDEGEESNEEDWV
ncbi:TATA box-binding protein-like 1 [Lycorma delicatula]|uniref:TATA box-binding protein-like 1 n=1 Tax=Lycorma delicatula TaxID=130591 RepID=UPI003F50F201